MKIKTKKEMTLPELIEWIERNGGYGMSFRSNRGSYVIVDEYGVLGFSGNFYKDTFTVEIEEPVTEDTVFDKLIIRYAFLSSNPSYAHSINTCIKDIEEDSSVATHIYLENEDNELQLIWTREKGLVE